MNEGSLYRGDILIKDGLFTSVNEIFIHDIHVDEIMDASGLLILPGIIDDQVHFRQPGLENKGTIESESRAAVAGGITSFMEMPNTIPPTITIDKIKEKEVIAQHDSWCNYSFYLGATNDNISDIEAINPSKTCGVKVFMGSSTGDLLVDSEVALRRIFSNNVVPIAVHSEDESTIRNNLDLFKLRYGSNGTTELHPLVRSREACIICTNRAIDYSEKFGGHLHLLHISTAEEVEIIRKAKVRGVNITAEVCVHHLFFSDEDYKRKGNMIKWNPSIKSKSDRDALMAGLNDGTIDIVATDHAPHELKSKLNDYFSAPSGGPMVEHSLVLMLRMVSEFKCCIEDVVKWMAHNPADIFKINKRGYIRNGYYADLTIVTQSDPWQVKNDMTQYLVKWSPIDGEWLLHRVVATVVNGRFVFQHGVFHENNRNPMALKFDRI